jgi:hypothetical protein
MAQMIVMRDSLKVVRPRGFVDVLDVFVGVASVFDD